jgi:hypothetical protein
VTSNGQRFSIKTSSCCGPLDKSIKFSKGWRIFFARLDESVIRDATGQPMAIESLGLSYNSLGMCYCSISYAPLLKNPGAGWPDGHLYTVLMRDTEHKYKKLRIYELPPNIEFPLPEGFGWDAWVSAANDYLKETNQTFKNYEEWIDWDRKYPTSRFFPDRVVNKTYTYKHDLGHTILTNSPPMDGRPYTVE